MKKTSHKAKTSTEWTRRLHCFAAGERFGREERPAKGSHWNRVLERNYSIPISPSLALDCCLLIVHLVKYFKIWQWLLIFLDQQELYGHSTASLQY